MPPECDAVVYMIDAFNVFKIILYAIILVHVHVIFVILIDVVSNHSPV